MKKAIPVLLLLAIGAVAAFAEDRPPIAVYVVGGIPNNDKSVLGTRMLASLVNSGRYMGIERSDQFLTEIDNEIVTQQGGSVDDSQISQVGKRFGVKFVCIAAITPAFDSYQISARIVDVETAEVAFIGESTSPLKTMGDFTRVTRNVVKIMFGEQIESDAADSPKPKTGVSLGAGAYFAGDFGGGLVWSGDSGGVVKMPCQGFGAYLFFDAVYAEAFVAYYAGGGKWESPNRTGTDGALEMNRASLNFGAFAKYPIALGKINAFPLIGFEYETSIYGKLTRNNGTKRQFDGKDGSPGEAGDLSALWLKLGCGVDVGLSETVYLRSELLYGARTANTFEESDSEAQTRIGHGLTVRVGVGAKF